MTDKEKDLYKRRLIRLYDEAVNELNHIGIMPDCRIFGITVNSRAKKRLGCCKQVIADGVRGYEIEISSLLYDKEDQIVKEIILHELLHTCKDCFNHGNKWKKYAHQVKEEYGYNITSRADYSELDLDVSCSNPYKYCIRCTACGQESYRLRRSKVIEHLKLYKCRFCGGALEVINL